MKLKLSAVLAALVVISGCAPTFEKQEQVVQENETDQSRKAIIPSYQIADHYYRTLLPYEESETRGIVVNNVQSRYDINELENGLMDLARTQFSSKEYLFKEGQVLNKDIVSGWLQRKYTPEQLKEKNLNEADNIGLNPTEVQGQNTPIYLTHILEQNYLEKQEDGKVYLGGLVIGLSLNSVQYEVNPSSGESILKEMSEEEVRTEGQRIANEIMKRLRDREDLNGVPIMMALFKQAPRHSISPGYYISVGMSDGSSESINEWTNVNDQVFMFPSEKATEAKPQDASLFKAFSTKLENYFPNYTGVTGKASYNDDGLESIKISIPISYNGKAETIGFTQYVSKLASESLPKEWDVEMMIRSESGPEALILLGENSNNAKVHVYE